MATCLAATCLVQLLIFGLTMALMELGSNWKPCPQQQCTPRVPSASAVVVIMHTSPLWAAKVCIMAPPSNVSMRTQHETFVLENWRFHC